MSESPSSPAISESIKWGAPVCVVTRPVPNVCSGKVLGANVTSWASGISMTPERLVSS